MLPTLICYSCSSSCSLNGSDLFFLFPKPFSQFNGSSIQDLPAAFKLFVLLYAVHSPFLTQRNNSKKRAWCVGSQAHTLLHPACEPQENTVQVALRELFSSFLSVHHVSNLLAQVTVVFIVFQFLFLSMNWH